MRQNNQKHNGPSVDCYGLAGSSKLNYEFGGYCYESAYPGSEWYSNGIPESRWHAIQHTLGLDFSKTDLGSILVKNDNSGNCYLGAFDPYCSGTDEKWKVHADNEFGTPQHQDLTQDKYYEPLKTHGSTINSQFVHSYDTEVQSIKNKPMTWNLWNIVRHYCYIKYFKNKNKQVNNESAWNELEAKTRKHVRAIYRTFKEKQGQNNTTTFGDKLGGESISNYGDECSVRWTNSFVQIASVLERNARDHMASLVMFTGSDAGTGIAREQYDAIRNSTYNFRVTTLNGMDDDDDGMRPRKPGVDGWVSSRPADSGKDLHTFQGFTYGQLPSSYVIGDDTVYDQMLPGVSVNLTTPLDMDKAYPESEFRLDDPTKKWIRTMTKTIMEQQVLPIYTTMENMTQDYHDLTDEDMKGITFKLIPQLYWKYEWSFNEYMIHPVGKLNPTSNNPEMYDMLGNVWELVRDDWSDNIKDLNAKHNPVTNPIVDNNNNDKAVIKGGAFDQFCRKTISATRESIGRNEYKSEHGTQANVGFRPALEYTFEMSDGAGFTYGEPVDLFFLFDASASQNNQITTMMNQAEEIVKQFATDDPNVCHVGSALFMGPKVKMMCSEQVGSFTRNYQVQWTNSCYDKHGPKELPEKHWYNDESKKNKNKYLISSSDPLDSNKEVTAISDLGGVKQTFVNLLNRFKTVYHSSDLVYRSSSMGSKMMSSRGDTGNTGGGGGNPHGTGTLDYAWWYEVSLLPKTMHAHCGVPAWKENIYDSDNNIKEVKLHFGECANMGFNKVLFNASKRLFTYNPTRSGIDDFEFPFLQDNNGGLSNYWSGIEPTSHILSQLLGDGMFYEWPYNDGIGYMFRSDEIPKLVFVFTNEFDNESQGTKGRKGLTVVPGVKNNSVIFGVVETDNKDPIDPYCFRVLTEDESKLNEFLDQQNVKVKPSFSTVKSVYSSLNENLGAKDVGMSSFPIKTKVTKKSDDKVNSIDKNQKLKNNDMMGYDNPITGLEASDILGSDLSFINQIDTSKKITIEATDPDLKAISGITYKYSGGDLYAQTISYKEFQTVGYYSLLREIKKNQSTTNTILLTTSTSAPKPLFDTGWYINEKDELVNSNPDITLTADEMNKIAKSYLVCYSDAFDLIKNQDVPSELKSIMSGSKYDWNSFMHQSKAAIAKSYPKDDYSVIATDDTCKTFHNLFSLENPRTSVQFIYSQRTNHSSLYDHKYILGVDNVTARNMIFLDNKSTYYCSINENTNVEKALYGNYIKDVNNFVTNYSKIESEAEREEYLNSYVFTFERQICTRDQFNSRQQKMPRMSKYNLTLENMQLFGVSKTGWTRGNIIDIIKEDSNWVTDASGNTVINSDVLSNLKINLANNKAYYIINKIFSSKSANTYLSKGYFHLWLSGLDGEYIYDHRNFDGYDTILTDKNGYRALNDVVTITYGTTNVNPDGSGTLKIIDLNCAIISGDTADKINSIRLDGGKSFKIGHHWGDNAKDFLDILFNALFTNPQDVSYPRAWDIILHNYVDSDSGRKLTWSKDSLKFIIKLYNDFQKVCPTLLSYRFYDQIFKHIKNKQGISVTDYENEKAYFVVKCLPVYDITSLYETVSNVGLQLNSSGKFAYQSCVIDLNPSPSDYSVRYPDGKFPMKFCSVQSPNSDEYKTSKIILSRVNSISADEQVSFTMGSKSTDYNEVNDSELEKYKDDDSIMQGAENDNATVTLTNGGSYQRNGEKENKKTGISSSGFYGLTWGNDSTNNSLSEAITRTNKELNTNIDQEDYRNLIGKERYFKNKYLFIDPFELTIAQWCYVHGNSNERSAKEFLVTANQYNDMRLSYWKYLMVYEKDKWNNLRNTEWGFLPEKSDDEVFEALTVNPDRYDNTYNPLTDTRPYYYATYNDVRGSNRLLDPDTYGYTFDNKDEYQLVNNVPSENPSFMDILNSKVVVQTTPRIYDASIDSTGVKWFNQFKVNYYKEQWNHNNKTKYWDYPSVSSYDKLKDVWCGGEIAGLNFDLPTEAQWEYCCRRMGESTTAFPPNFNLNDNFEEQEQGLDLIAWYKYKMLGSKPEPERFCAWRAAKFIFGITKDKEQVNNVYEENYDSPYGNR